MAVECIPERTLAESYERLQSRFNKLAYAFEMLANEHERVSERTGYLLAPRTSFVRIAIANGRAQTDGP